MKYKPTRGELLTIATVAIIAGILFLIACMLKPENLYSALMLNLASEALGVLITVLVVQRLLNGDDNRAKQKPRHRANSQISGLISSTQMTLAFLFGFASQFRGVDFSDGKQARKFLEGIPLAIREYLKQLDTDTYDLKMSRREAEKLRDNLTSAKQKLNEVTQNYGYALTTKQQDIIDEIRLPLDMAEQIVTYMLVDISNNDVLAINSLKSALWSLILTLEEQNVRIST